jgi:hypothetical protein
MRPFFFFIETPFPRAEDLPVPQEAGNRGPSEVFPGAPLLAAGSGEPRLVVKRPQTEFPTVRSAHRRSYIHHIGLFFCGREAYLCHHFAKGDDAALEPGRHRSEVAQHLSADDVAQLPGRWKYGF